MFKSWAKIRNPKRLMEGIYRPLQNDAYIYTMNKIVGVASGGFTSEYGISKKSGQVIYDLIKESPYEVYQINASLDQWTVSDQQENNYPLDLSNFSFKKAGESLSFDYVVNMIHGAPGENGELASILEQLHIPHSSCDSDQAAMTYSKRDCLVAANKIGVPTAKRFILNQGEHYSIDAIEAAVGLPCFVKANRAGSSFGVYKIYAKNDLDSAIEKAFEEDHEILIETALEGREITVGVVHYKGVIKVLPLTEIVTENEFFDYKAKYEGQSEEITPAKLPKAWEEKIIATAKHLYDKLELKGITRSEFIFQNDLPHLLEINTIPGMTHQSIIPQQAQAAGIPLKELILDLIKTGLAKKM